MGMIPLISEQQEPWGQCQGLREEGYPEDCLSRYHTAKSWQSTISAKKREHSQPTLPKGSGSQLGLLLSAKYDRLGV